MPTAFAISDHTYTALCAHIARVPGAALGGEALSSSSSPPPSTSMANNRVIMASYNTESGRGYIGMHALNHHDPPALLPPRLPPGHEERQPVPAVSGAVACLELRRRQKQRRPCNGWLADLITQYPQAVTIINY